MISSRSRMPFAGRATEVAKVTLSDYVLEGRIKVFKEALDQTDCTFATVKSA